MKNPEQWFTVFSVAIPIFLTVMIKPSKSSPMNVNAPCCIPASIDRLRAIDSRKTVEDLLQKDHACCMSDKGWSVESPGAQRRITCADSHVRSHTDVHTVKHPRCICPSPSLSLGGQWSPEGRRSIGYSFSDSPFCLPRSICSCVHQSSGDGIYAHMSFGLTGLSSVRCF